MTKEKIAMIDVDSDRWISPNKVLWGVFRAGFKNVVVVGEREDGTFEVFSSTGGRKANSLMTKAIRFVKKN